MPDWWTSRGDPDWVAVCAFPLLASALLSGCASLHPAEEHLRAEASVLHAPCFTRFHQDLGWLSCLRSPTFRHAVEHLVSHVSPDELRPVFLGVLFDTVQSSVLPSCLLDLHSCHRYLDTQ